MRITHMLRLKNAEQATEVFLKAIDPLRTSRRLGPVLFQLPPQMKCDVGLLRRLPGAPPQRACGMRSNSGTNRGWWRRSTTSCGANNVSLCVAESEKLEVPEVITADFVYYRLRKQEYTEEDVDAWAAARQGIAGHWRDLYLMFKHEETPEGALNAELLMKKAG
jgi:uncharacterized protein YecE (DUF72 family)